MTDWPVLTRYEAERLMKVALPLGGIGTGTISLGGRGNLRDFEIANRPAKGFTPGNAFFALYVAGPDGESVTRCLEGPIPDHLFEGSSGAVASNHGLPRFRECAFEAAYPLGQVHLSDPEVPVKVRLQAFNPMIPGDAARSGIPVAVFRWILTNTTDQTLTAAVCANLPNFIGNDGTAKLAKANRSQYRETDTLVGVLLQPGEVDSEADSWGTIAISTLAPHPQPLSPSDGERGESRDERGDGENESAQSTELPSPHRMGRGAGGEGHVSYRTAWAQRNWGDSLLDYWDDFSADGQLEERDPGTVDQPVASLAVRRTLAPGETVEIPFLLTWHFPNRKSWTNNHPVVGNWYATQYEDAWAVAEKTAADMESLEADTVAFVQDFVASDLPHSVKEAALNNAVTLRTQTAFRTPDGRFFGWEGCGDNSGCCLGSCTHVWNYEVTTPFLYGGLSRTMREVEFGYSTRDTGHMSFRVHLPLEFGTESFLAAADGQMGCLMKMYRDWRLSGDDDFLRRLWPKVKRSLEFCWAPGGWDADRDGVMEGCQHNTMDVEYYGPNPEMGTWYLGALRAGEEMARYLGDDAFADECRRLFENGSKFLDEVLFNGDYYEHHIVPLTSEKDIAPGLRHESMGARNLSEPELQLGAGCLIDQLVGQYMAHICGLGYLLKPQNVQKTLESLMRYNFRETLWGHFNNLRTYALADEAGMLMATYPKGRRPERPFPYASEVWTGLEYVAAAGMLYEGMTDDGIKVVSAARARHDGRRRSPFDEPECGHHYARAMSAWATVLALTGFSYDGVTKEMAFAAAETPVNWFWSNGDAYGTLRQEPDANGSRSVTLTVRGGTLPLSRFVLQGVGDVAVDAPGGITAGQSITLQVD
jgi:uncharacterized protein (DUF608 family)